MFFFFISVIVSLSPQSNISKNSSLIKKVCQLKQGTVESILKEATEIDDFKESRYHLYKEILLQKITKNPFLVNNKLFYLLIRLLNQNEKVIRDFVKDVFSSKLNQFIIDDQRSPAQNEPNLLLLNLILEYEKVPQEKEGVYLSLCKELFEKKGLSEELFTCVFFYIKEEEKRLRLVEYIKGIPLSEWCQSELKKKVRNKEEEELVRILKKSQKSSEKTCSFIYEQIAILTSYPDVFLLQKEEHRLYPQVVFYLLENMKYYLKYPEFMEKMLKNQFEYFFEGEMESFIEAKGETMATYLIKKIRLVSSSMRAIEVILTRGLIRYIKETEGLVSKKNKRGESPICLAIEFNLLNVLDKILEQGGDIFETTHMFNSFCVAIHMILDSTRSEEDKEKLKNTVFNHYRGFKAKSQSIGLPHSWTFIDDPHTRGLNEIAFFEPPPVSDVLLECDPEDLELSLDVFDKVVKEEEAHNPSFVNQKSRFGIPPISYAVSQRVLTGASRGEYMSERLHNLVKDSKSKHACVYVKKLLERKADPNIQDDFGRTPLMYAVNSASSISLLLEKGANPCLQDKQGRSFFYYLFKWTRDNSVNKVLGDILNEKNREESVEMLNKILTQKDDFGFSLLDYNQYIKKMEHLIKKRTQEYFDFKMKVGRIEDNLNQLALKWEEVYINSIDKNRPMTKEEEEMMSVVLNDEFLLGHFSGDESKESYEEYKGVSSFSSFVFLFERIFFPWNRQEIFYNKVLGDFFERIKSDITKMSVEKFQKELDILKEKGLSSDTFFMMYSYLRRISCMSQTGLEVRPYMEKLFPYCSLSKENLLVPSFWLKNEERVNTYEKTRSLHQCFWLESKEGFDILKVKEEILNDKESSFDPSSWLKNEERVNTYEKIRNLYQCFWLESKERFDILKVKEAILNDSEPKILCLIEMLSDEEVSELIDVLNSSGKQLPFYNNKDDFRRFAYFRLFRRQALLSACKVIEFRALRDVQIEKERERMQREVRLNPFLIELNEKQEKEVFISFLIGSKTIKSPLSKAQVYGRSLAFLVCVDNQEKLIVLKLRKKGETSQEFCDGAVLSTMQLECLDCTEGFSDCHLLIENREEVINKVEELIQTKGTNTESIALEGTGVQFVAPENYFNYIQNHEEWDFKGYSQEMLSSAKKYLQAYKKGFTFSGYTARSHGQGRFYQYAPYLIIGNYSMNSLGALEQVALSTDNNFRREGIRDFGNYKSVLFLGKERFDKIRNNMGFNNKIFTLDKHKEEVLSGDIQSIIDELIQTLFLEHLLFLWFHPNQLAVLSQEAWLSCVEGWAYLLWEVFKKEDESFEDSIYFLIIKTNKELLVRDFELFKENKDIINYGYLRDTARDFPLQNTAFVLTTLISQFRLQEFDFIKSNQEVESLGQKVLKSLFYSDSLKNDLSRSA